MKYLTWNWEHWHFRQRDWHWQRHATLSCHPSFSRIFLHDRFIPHSYFIEIVCHHLWKFDIGSAAGFPPSSYKFQCHQQALFQPIYANLSQAKRGCMQVRVIYCFRLSLYCAQYVTILLITSFQPRQTVKLLHLKQMFQNITTRCGGPYKFNSNTRCIVHATFVGFDWYFIGGSVPMVTYIKVLNLI